MKNAMLALVLALTSVAGAALVAPAHAAIRPAPDRSMEREQVLERLVDAETTLQAFDIAGARTRLEQLASDLAHDTVPFNRGIREHVNAIVEALDASQVREAQTKLEALIKGVRNGVMPHFGDLGGTAAI